MAANEVLALSERLLLATKRDNPADDLQATLRSLNGQQLADALDTDSEKKAFWINVYNAYVQLELRENPDRYDKNSFFGERFVPVAGREFTLDEIEHGILRGSKWKYGLGYIPHPFPGEFEKRHRVEECDWRLHFALNCGAKSCPPIASYSADRIDDQLDTAAHSYLSQEVEYDANAGRVHIPRLCLWYRGDFGGKSGIVSLLREFDQIPGEASPRLKHKEYDWSLALDRFADPRET
jgi:hypothetical protein